MIKVITNSLGSGDWITVRDTNTGETLFEGHRISARDLVEILSFDGSTEAKLVQVTDEEMEEGEY
jgi:uncharacterized protein (DUF433 family)